MPPTAGREIEHLVQQRKEDQEITMRVCKDFETLVKLDGEARHERARPPPEEIPNRLNRMRLILAA